jgi:hypothetical protein
VSEVEIGPDGYFYEVDGRGYYIDGSRSVLLIEGRHTEDPIRGGGLYGLHSKNACAGENCVIHNPSEHSMRSFPTLWRRDRYMMERTCPHGVGHPDPDHLAAIRKLRGEEAAKVEGVHGCDGCCHVHEDDGEDDYYRHRSYGG